MNAQQKDALKDEIAQMVRATFDDQHVSRSERQALKQVLSDYSEHSEVQDIFRQAAFNVAYGAVQDSDTRQLIEWLDRLLKLGRPPKPEQMTASSYFSPGTTCRSAICKNLGTARKTVDICVFTITDNDVVQAIERTHRRGIRVRIISDNDKMYDHGSDIRHLAAQGIDIRVDESPHVG